MWADFFAEISVNFCGTRYVEYDLLVKEMEKKLPHIDKEIRTKLYFLFNYEGDSIISEISFNHIMKIWSAFSANDLNNDNELDAFEMKTLFWLYDGKKPNKERVEREKVIMDADGSGTIDRLEWLAYLCSSSLEQQRDYYDFNLRGMFEQADKRKKGELTQPEVIEFLRMDMKTSIERMPQDGLYLLDDIFRKAAVEVFTILMGRTPNGKSDSMDWVTMKNYRHKCRARIEQLE